MPISQIVTNGLANIAATVPKGGTGLGTLTANNLLVGNGTGAVNLIAPGTNGQVLTSNGVVWAPATPAASTTFSAGTTGFTPSTASSGAVVLAGTLGVANGGTGLTAPGASGNVLTSNGTAWISAAAASSGGIPSNATVNNVTSSRSNGSTYTNSRSYPIMVFIYCSDNAGQGISLVFTINSTSLPTLGGSPAGVTRQNSYIVPAGATYGASWNASGSFSGWWELY